MVMRLPVFQEILDAPLERRDDLFLHSLIELGVEPMLLQRGLVAPEESNFLDLLIHMETSGPLTARHLGRWLQAFSIGFARYASAEGFRTPELRIVEIGVGSFRVRLRKVNDVIALPGFLLGIYALFSQAGGVDEETLRRVLAEQRPAAVATADLLEKDCAQSIDISIGDRHLGRVTADDAKTFRTLDKRLRTGGPKDNDVPDPEHPAIPTWRAILHRPLYAQDPFLLSDREDRHAMPLRLSAPEPRFRDGWIYGTFLVAGHAPYVRLEGMEGVLLPLKGPADLVSWLRDGESYRFVGAFEHRHDGLRTAFVARNVEKL